MSKKVDSSIIATNSKAFHNYFLSDFLEVGISLLGTEIKSIKKHSVSLSDSYVAIIKNEAYIYNMHIAKYEQGNIFNHEPLRPRKLLMHSYEIIRYQSKIQEKGFTLIATKIYLKKGKAKLQIALGKGKKLFDKRETMKKRDIDRDIAKATKRNQ